MNICHGPARTAGQGLAIKHPSWLERGQAAYICRRDSELQWERRNPLLCQPCSCVRKPKPSQQRQLSPMWGKSALLTGHRCKHWHTVRGLSWRRAFSEILRPADTVNRPRMAKDCPSHSPVHLCRGVPSLRFLEPACESHNTFESHRCLKHQGPALRLRELRKHPETYRFKTTTVIIVMITHRWLSSNTSSSLATAA